MAYSSNPRIVKGKVEVIFADTDISSISGVTVSGNADISHPNEVYGSNLNPTVKACTMDGNSIMDGTFQMMDDTCTLGWWGDKLSDDEGEFKEQQDMIISFARRPIGSWTIIGDTKLEQYPVDFRIDFVRDNQAVQSVSFMDNTEIVKKIYPNVIDIDKVAITIFKWSTPNACVKLMKFFDMLSEVYEGSDLLSFEVNEEMSSEDANYNINSDTMCVSIYNKDKKFTTGYLKNLLVLDRKVKPYIGIEENGVVTYTSLGVFYSDEWKIEDDGMWIKCTAVDKLMRLQNKTYVGMDVSFSVTLYDIAEDILLKAGFDRSKFEISDDLDAIVIPTAFMPKDTVWNALQEIANTGLCKIYINRDDRVIVRSETDYVADSGIVLNPSNSFSQNSNISLTEFANKVSVEYCDVEIGDEVVTAAEVSIILDPNETLDITIDYTTEVAYSQVIADNTNMQLSNIKTGVNACMLTITNTTGTVQQGTITVEGSAIDITYKTISVIDEQSVRDYGEFEYSHPSSELVQTSQLATRIASTILSKMKAGEGVITTKWRGDTALTLGKKFKVINRSNVENTLLCEYNKISYDGGLTQETRGRKV